MQITRGDIRPSCGDMPVPMPCGGLRETRPTCIRVCVNLVDVLAVMLNVFSFCIRLGQESD
jgi:hypothetical protein